MKTELFTPLLAWLDAGAPHTTYGVDFNMTYFCHQAFNGCHTAVCMAGALAQIHDLELVDDDHYEDKIRKVAEFVGLTTKQAADLFYAGPTVTSAGKFLGYRLLSNITPAGAAHALRTFLATGKCDWSKYDE